MSKGLSLVRALKKWRWWRRNITLFTFLIVLFVCLNALCSELWLITAYCPCVKCCGKSDNITASGKLGRYGYVACNWLKFGTEVNIDGLGVFKVQDRGAKSLFGSRDNHIKHLDVYFSNHKEALKFGRQYREVKILGKEG